MSMLGRTGTIVRKNRRRSGGPMRTAPKHNAKDTRFRRASAPTMSPQTPSFPALTPMSRSAETVARPCLSPNPSPGPSPSPSKSVSFSTEVEEVQIPRPDSLSLSISIQQTPPPEKVFYDSTVVWPEVEEEEPRFSVVSGICEAGLESRGPCEFLHRAFFLLSGTWPVTVLLVILLALPLVMTTIGVNYLHDCPREPKLPIYLVVGGCFGILKLIFLLWKQVRRHKDVTDLHDDEDLLTMTRMTNIALNIFLTIWFVFGHYWVVGIWKPHFTPPLHEPRNWCERTVFLFSFWQLVICHIVIALMIAVGLMLLCCYTCVRCLMTESNKR